MVRRREGREKERAVKGKLHSEVISLKDSISLSEVLIVHTHTHTHTRKHWLEQLKTLSSIINVWNP